MENKINEKKNEILNSLKGLTYKEFRQLLRMLENEVENTTTIN
jgi:DNA topoisomerase VI subunit A